MHKYIVFDLDETICFLSQLYALHLTFANLNDVPMTQEKFTELLNKLPCVFRPGIFVLLAYIRVLKDRLRFSLVLYTNSTLPYNWIHFLISYMELKCHCNKLFDHVIDLHTVNRYTTDKSIDDILKYCKHSDKPYTFFVVDDKNHKHLIDNRVEYNLMTSYRYYYNNSVIWSCLHDAYCIRRTQDITHNRVDKKKNNQRHTVCKQEIRKLFPLVYEFLCR